MATPKQEKLVTLLIENYGAAKPRSLGDLMLEAGYSEASAHNPKLILEGEAVQVGIKDAANRIEQIRNNALAELEARDVSEERYSDVVKAVDLLTKNHQLLSGGETERNEMTISWKS